LFQENNYRNTTIKAKYDYLKYWVTTLFVSIKQGNGRRVTCHAGTGKSTSIALLILNLGAMEGGLGGQCHAQAALPPEKSASTHYTGGWVGPRAGSCPHWGSNPEPSSLWRVTILTMLPWPLYSSAYNIVHMEELLCSWSGWNLLRNFGTITHFHLDEDNVNAVIQH
jgi:hypothetical protein